MAIVWQPNDQVQGISIGGSITNDANTVAGPFPNFSISRECLRKDNLYLGQKYTINITGTAVIVESSDMLTSGDRQEEIHKIDKKLLSISNTQGKLTIEDYGGVSTLVFNDAVLLSVDVPQQNAESRGVQAQEYTFTFEATDLENVTEEGSTYNIVDVTEVWDFSLADGSYTQVAFEAKAGPGDTPPATNNVKRQYNISHNLSATGLVSNNAGARTSGYYEAKKYVNTRLRELGTNPLAASTIKDYGTGAGQQDIFQLDDTTAAKNNFAPFRLPSSGDTYVCYNQVNSYNQDILGGTFGVNRSWLASPFAASVTIDLTYNADNAAVANVVEASVNIQGLETIVASTANQPYNPETTTTDKYQNARSVAETHFLNEDAVTGKTGIFSIAELFYGERGPDGGTLRSVELSQSQSHSQTTGTISISASFDDATISLEGAISENVSITDTNYDGTNEIVAILPVIAKSDGPVIQDMGTTNERTRSVSFEAVMAKDKRDTKPTVDLSGYKPSSSAYQTNITDTWSPTSGSYNKTVEWVWTGSVT